MSQQREISNLVGMFSKVIACLEQNIRKQIDCQRPLEAKQMNIVQNIRIGICKWKYDQVRLEIAVFASTFCLH